MSSTDRQNRLLVAEDWKRIYQSYRNADFQSYDFDNLRRTMINYLRTNYPEDFNDYIESSEYLALIDLIAFLGQNISFRIDLNSRENFLELAERRESVLRLARLLSYNPKRNQAAEGLLKVTSISTSQDVIDSNSFNLAGQQITWNDPSNTNWYEQFIKVLNAALPANGVFGKPAKKATVSNIPHEQYRFNAINTDIPKYSFSKTIEGQSLPFEVVSSDIVDNAIEEEIQFELKTTTPQAEINEIETKSEEVSPLDLTISELQKRAEERRKKMKGFNYKFNDQLNKNIDEIERQPAYKRLGVDLDTNAAISKTKTTIKKDTDDLGLSNNSFLHDNVD